MYRHFRSVTVVVLLLATLLLTACQRAAPPEAAVDAVQPVALQPISVTVAPVAQRNVQQRVSVVGTLYGLEDITVTPKVEGRVQRIYHDVGDRVPPETVLLEIDATDYKLAETEARRALESQLAQLGLTEPPPSNFSIAQLPSVQRAQLLLDYAVRHLERTNSLLQRSAASQEDFDRATTDEQVARANLAQVKLEAAAALASVQHRQAVLATAEQRLADTIVQAPRLPSTSISGERVAQYVVAQRLVSEGEMVRAFPSAPAFELVVDDVLKLRVRVPERFSSQVIVGQPVEVRVEAYADEVFPARITRINPTIDSASRTFEIEAQVQNADHRLRHGGFAKADVIVREAQEAITIPITSLVRFAGVNKVFVVERDKVREVPVEIAQRQIDWLEVTGQLKPQDLVVTSGHGALFDGAPVAVRATADSQTPATTPMPTSAAAPSTNLSETR